MAALPYSRKAGDCHGGVISFPILPLPQPSRVIEIAVSACIIDKLTNFASGTKDRKEKSDWIWGGQGQAVRVLYVVGCPDRLSARFHPKLGVNCITFFSNILARLPGHRSEGLLNQGGLCAPSRAPRGNGIWMAIGTAVELETFGFDIVDGVRWIDADMWACSFTLGRKTGLVGFARPLISCDLRDGGREKDCLAHAYLMQHLPFLQ